MANVFKVAARLRKAEKISAELWNKYGGQTTADDLIEALEGWDGEWKLLAHALGVSPPSEDTIVLVLAMLVNHEKKASA